MAKIEMDVTEYDALRKNIALLEESKKETAKLTKQIDLLKEEKLEVFRNMQMKVVKHTTIENISRTVRTRNTLEFDNFVKSLVRGIVSRMFGNNYENNRERRYRDDSRSMNNFDYHPQDMFGPSMNHSSATEFVEYELSSFLGTLITTTSVKNSEPVYVGLEQVQAELYTRLVSSQTSKIKDLLALEPAYNDFTNKKAELEGMTNTLLKEKLELGTKLVSTNETNVKLKEQNQKFIEIQLLYENSLTDMVGQFQSKFYMFPRNLKKDITQYLGDLNIEVNELAEKK